MLQTIEKSNMKLKMISCSSCGEPMPELRLTKYGYDYCIKCSEAGLGEGRKQGIPVLMGEGDHTWTETVIMTADQYDSYLAQEKAEKKLDKSDRAERIDFDKEDAREIKGKRNLQGSAQITDSNENK
tara:strand:- start:114 stop:494 length:381 start_codon:yes stop_codon:yes gene_type:complete